MAIHYISFYTNTKKRRQVSSGISKIEYMLDVLKSLDERVVAVSTASSAETGLQRGFTEGDVLYLPSLCIKGAVGRRLNLFYMQWKLFRYLMKHVSNDDLVMYYHSMSYAWPLRWARRFKRFKFIMEFNDKYSYHYTNKKKAAKVDTIEKKLIAEADAYVFASPMMLDLTQGNKPYTVNYGSYAPAEAQMRKKEKTLDGKVHLLYSGVLEPLRKAGELAIEAMEALPENYVLHIAGFGNEAYVSEVRRKITEINQKKGFEAIVFHGFLNQVQLGDLMQMCDISLSTHKYEFAWQSDLSFPSKIPLNMANGLYMVTQDLPVIFNSPFKDAICFYGGDAPTDVAKAIRNCAETLLKEQSVIPSEIVAELDRNFRADLKEIRNALLRR